MLERLLPSEPEKLCNVVNCAEQTTAVTTQNTITMQTVFHELIFLVMPPRPRLDTELETSALRRGPGRTQVSSISYPFSPRLAPEPSTAQHSLTSGAGLSVTLTTERRDIPKWHFAELRGGKQVSADDCSATVPCARPRGRRYGNDRPAISSSKYGRSEAAGDAYPWPAAARSARSRAWPRAMRPAGMEVSPSRRRGNIGTLSAPVTSQRIRIARFSTG